MEVEKQEGEEEVVLMLWLFPHHARSGVLSYERVPQHLRQLARSERSVGFVPAQGSDALLQKNHRDAMSDRIQASGEDAEAEDV